MIPMCGMYLMYGMYICAYVRTNVCILFCHTWDTCVACTACAAFAACMNVCVFTYEHVG